MDDDFMDQDLIETPMQHDPSGQGTAGDDEDTPDTVPVPRSLIPHLSETAILLDIDGTLLDLAPTPREVWVPPGLAKTLLRDPVSISAPNNMGPATPPMPVPIA